MDPGLAHLRIAGTPVHLDRVRRVTEDDLREIRTGADCVELSGLQKD